MFGVLSRKDDDFATKSLANDLEEVPGSVNEKEEFTAEEEERSHDQLPS